MGDVFAHLVLPVRPVVAAHGTPVIERMSNALVREDSGKMVRGTGIFPGAGAGSQMNVAGFQLAVDPGIGKILDVVGGIVEIKIVVIHAIHEITKVIDTGHGEAALDHVGMLEERICGVIRTEGSAHRGDGHLRLAIAPNKRNNLFAQVGIEHSLDVTAVKRVRAFVVKTEAIDGIDGVELDAAGVNEIGERADHSLPFEFPFVSGAGRKTENGRTIVAVNDDAEFDAEAMRIPMVIVAVHKRAFQLPTGMSRTGEKYASREEDRQTPERLWWRGLIASNSLDDCFHSGK